MEGTRPLLVLVATLALTEGALTGCGSPGAPSRHELIDSRDNYDPRSLDPALSTDVPTGRAVGYLFDGLTRFSPEARVEPALAERWDVTPDGITYTFHLRRGVTFTDGAPVTARTVADSWRRALDPTTKSGAAQFLFPIKGARELNAGKATSISGVVVRDDSTLVVTLAEPLAIFIKMLAMPVASVVPEKTPPDFGEHPVGTGPWKLVEWKHDDYLLFAKNPSYYGGPAKTDSLRARVIAEPSTAVAEYESGNVDILQIPATQAADWLEDESRKPMLMSTPALELVYVGINTTRGPLTDVRVRQAINYAVDTDRIIERLVSGRGTHAQTIQAYLGAVGIRVKLVQREAAAARGAARKGQTDMLIKDWYADYPDAEDFLYPLLSSVNRGAGGNISFYSNPTFDSVVTASRRELNEAKRNVMYRQADSIAFNDAPMLFLYFYDELYAVQPWIKHFVPPVIFNGQRWTDVTIVTPPK